MSTENVPIKPTDKVETHTITSVDFSFFDYVLFKRVRAICSLRTADGHIVTNIPYTIEGDEFAAWGSDDQYIVDLLLTKLGLARPEPAAEEPVEEQKEEPVAEEPVVSMTIEETPAKEEVDLSTLSKEELLALLQSAK